MTTLADAKHEALRALTGSEGHVNDLEGEFLVSLGATAGKALVDQWFEVFDAAAVSTGHFNDRAVEYIVAQVGAPPSDDYNAHWQFYWENFMPGPVGPSPPGNPLLWYDFADPSTVFSDFAGTVPATEGDNIRNITDKGTQGQDLADSGSGLIYNEDVINGLAAALSTAITAMDNNFGFGTGGAGLTFACVAKHDGMPTQQKVFNWDGSRLIQQDELGSGNWECVVPNVPTTADTGAPVVDGEFIGVYLKHNNSLDFDVRASGEAEVVGSTIDFFNVGAFETFQIGVFDGHISEVLVYESFLDATDSQALLDYFDAKYGTLPRAEIPAQANLQMWWDFTDAGTVWEDVAGTIPATDDGVINRIDNKGFANLTELDDIDTNQLTYRTNVVNGLNVAGASVESDIRGRMTGTQPGATGMAFATFARRTDTPTTVRNHRIAWPLNRNRIEPDEVGPNWLAGPGFDTLKTVVQDEWVWVYGTIATNDNRVKASGGVEQVDNVTAYVQSGDTEFFNIIEHEGEYAEVLVWDRPLTATETADLEAYFNSKYGVAPFPGVPPTVAKLVHHFDFTNNATVWRNPGRTQQAEDGDQIRVIDNLGADPTALTGTAGGGVNSGPIYRENIINGENIGDFSNAGLGRLMSGTVPSPLAIEVGGLTMVAVARFINSTGASSILYEWDSAPSFDFQNPSPELARWFSPGVPNQVLVNPLLADTWYLLYVSLEQGGSTNDAIFGSPGPESTAAMSDTIATIGANSLMQIAPATWDVQVGEVAYFDGPLTAAERAAIVAYADLKYGALPITAPPVPALGSLTHHVDPSDASTVWADAAATIPAVNGGTVDRIDNKGTDGTPLASVTGSPIYRTGVLNGTNIIEFSSANLTALAVAAGLTISTTGYTIAMVTRRRATHIGDSILWRWTPFVGTPGPSLRGRFSLNGNFHRADPIADEDLVANPAALDTWYLLYFSAEAGGATDDAKFGSPGPEVAGPWADLTDIPDLADVRYGTSSTLVQHAEAWFWDRPLTSAERAQLVAYADAKYGTLPHT